MSFQIFYFNCLSNLTSIQWGFNWSKLNYPAVNSHGNENPLLVGRCRKLYLQKSPIFQPAMLVYCSVTGWWFQPIWKICSSNWIIARGIGMKIKNMWSFTTQVTNPTPTKKPRVPTFSRNVSCRQPSSPAKNSGTSASFKRSPRLVMEALSSPGKTTAREGTPKCSEKWWWKKTL